MPLSKSDPASEEKHAMFNLSPDVDGDMEDESADQAMPIPADMPHRSQSHGPLRLPSSLSRSRSARRAASTLEKSLSRLPSVTEYESERTAALDRLESTSGMKASKIMISAASFEQAVMDRTGSTLFASRLFESQNPEGAEEVPAERLVDALLTLEHASLEDHLRITFELLDTRNDGTIAAENLAEILRVAFANLKIPVTEKQLLRVSEALIADIHANRSAPMEVVEEEFDEEAALNEPRFVSFNKKQQTEHVQFEELVALFKKHIDSMKPKAQARHTMGKRQILSTAWQKVKRTWLEIASISHLPFFVLFWIGMALCFFTGYYQNYKRAPAKVSKAAYPLAKAFAQVIQPAAALLLWAVCRRSITALRETPLKWVLPFDESINFHRICGYLILVCGLGHTICHIANYSVWTSPHYAKQWMAATGIPEHSKHYWWTTETTITGYLLLFAMLLGYPFAMWYPRMASFIKGTPVGRFLNNFTYFSVTHMAMWLIFFVALIIHPYPGLPSRHFYGRSTTWLYVSLPLLMYCIERVYRLVYPFALRGELLDVELLSGKDNVTVLRVRRPRGFVYTPGMYTFVNVPAISRMEWHPFTITSAPGDPYVSVHIRQAGDWTGALFKLMSTYAQKVETDMKGGPKSLSRVASTIGADGSINTSLSIARSMTISRSATSSNHSAKSATMRSAPTFGPQARRDGMTPTLQRSRTRASLRACDWDPLPNAPLVLLDGPYSAPAQHWEDYEVLLLVGAGIGVTPFASVLADMVNRMESRRCKTCGTVAHSHNLDGSGLVTDKIYFHWVVRDSRAPNYFASTLETISADDQLGLVEPRIHLTGVAPKPTGDQPDLHYIIAKLGQEALHQQSGVDVVTGLKSKVVTEFGRPKWAKVLANIAETHPGKTVGVFVCGPKPLSHELQSCCHDWNARPSTRIKVMDDDIPDLEAQAVHGRTIFHFYQEFF